MCVQATMKATARDVTSAAGNVKRALDPIPTTVSRAIRTG